MSNHLSSIACLPSSFWFRIEWIELICRWKFAALSNNVLLRHMLQNTEWYHDLCCEIRMLLIFAIGFDSCRRIRIICSQKLRKKRRMLGIQNILGSSHSCYCGCDNETINTTNRRRCTRMNVFEFWLSQFPDCSNGAENYSLYIW